MRNTRSKKKAGSRRRWTVAEAEAILGEYAKSGLTQRVFAQAVGIGVSGLQYWLRRQRRSRKQKHRHETSSARTSPEVPLLEVDLGGVAQGGWAFEEHYEIEWISGMRLRVPRGFRAEELKALLGAIKEAG